MAAHRGAPRTVKVLVTGPAGAGKTTFIATIAETSVLSSQPAAPGRSSGTGSAGAGDFGRFTLSDGLAVHLLGTSDEARPELLRDLLASGALGFVLLVDARWKETFDDAGRFLTRFSALADLPFVVAINRAGEKAEAAVAAARGRLHVPASVPVVATDARDREQVKRALVRLFQAAATPPVRASSEVRGQAAS